jgi:hypothetical protein
VVASAIGFQIDEIEMEFLQENSAWEFSHSLDPQQTSSFIKFISAVGSFRSSYDIRRESAMRAKADFRHAFGS